MGDTAANHRALVSEPGRGQAQVVVEIVQVGASDVTQLDVLDGYSIDFEVFPGRMSRS